MNATLKNLLQRIGSDMQKTAEAFHNANIGFEILSGYLEGSAAPSAPPQEESRSILFIELQKFKEIKRMLINLNIKGSVRERSGGLLELRVWLDGERKSIYGRTEDELRQKFNIVRRRRKQHAEIKTQNEIEKLYAWLEKWSKLYKKDTVKSRTFSAIISCIKVHIKTNFEDAQLNSFSPLQIEEKLKNIESTRMRKYAYQILNEAFRKAMQLKIIEENPFTLVDVPKHRGQKGTPLTAEEQENFKAALEGSQYRYYYLFLLYSGCRRCEGLAAHWEDVDFEKGRLFIRGTKTELSRSYIPLFDELTEILKEIKPTKCVGLIFPFSESAVEKQFKKLCPNHHLHDLRHTFATNCIEAGVDLKAVQAWLRHSNIGITADTYAHATDKFIMQEAEKLKKK